MGGTSSLYMGGAPSSVGDSSRCGSARCSIHGTPLFFIFIRTFSFYLILVSFVFLLDSRKVFERFLSTYTCVRRRSSKIAHSDYNFRTVSFNKNTVTSSLANFFDRQFFPSSFYLKDHRFKALPSYT